MRAVLAILFVIVSRAAALCEKEHSVELTNGEYNGVKYNHGEYFVDNVTRVERGCVCMKEICARKCCPFGQGYDIAKKLCLNVTERFNPPVWKEHQLVPGFNIMKELHFLFGKMNCSVKPREYRVPVAPAAEDFHLRTDGQLFVDIPANIPSTFIYGPDKYCIDTFVSDNSPPQLNALICFTAKQEKNNYAVSSTCMLISCFFIILTVAVYAWLPELRNLHGKVLMAYLISFFVGFLFLATMQILILKDDITQNMCTVLTFIIYFSLLSAFFWLNVMCYDIWWTFSGQRAVSGGSASPNKRFLYYCLYSFGVPTILTIILGALEFSDLPMQHPLLPKLRLQGCFLHGNSKLLYLYGPIVILCVANMTFFSLTAWKIAKIKQETKKMLQTKDSSTHDQERKDTQRFTLYLKLFTVMGINWILEVVSSFYPDADVFWQFPDAYNVLVGLIIFIIFVCKKKTLRMIKKRYRQMRGRPLSRAHTTTSISTRTFSSRSRDDLQMNSISK